jgi:hypothetical protein
MIVLRFGDLPPDSVLSLFTHVIDAEHLKGTADIEQKNAHLS